MPGLLSLRSPRRPHLAFVGSACAVLCACLLPWSAALASKACENSPAPSLTLSIVSGALRGLDKERLQVKVHDDSCVAVHRPWYLRDGGHYEIRLQAAEVQSLQREVAVEALRGVSEASLRREAKAAETRAQGRDGASQPEFHALDADVYALQWREGDAQRELVWTDVLNQAERHPESAGLNALARAVRALQPLLQREGKRIQSGGVR